MSSGSVGRTKSLAAGAFAAVVLIACSTTSESARSCLETGCGAHGRCAIEMEAAACVCEAGYAGPMCTECATGFQDSNGNGFCASSCAAVRCGAHEQCKEASGRAVCSCAVGYSRVGGGGCMFTGGPVDPSFERKPDVWTATGAATIVPGRASDVSGGGLGWARFNGTGEVFQSFEMPAYTDAEPLALALDLRCTRGGLCGNVDRRLIIRFDERIVHQPWVGEPRLHVCLGEAGFGRTLTLGIGTEKVDSSTSQPDGDMLIGRAQIVPRTRCAAPGTVRDGDFETGNWETTSPEGVAFGRYGGTRRARLASSCGGPGAGMATSISIPQALSSPALAFWIEGTPGAELFLSLDVGHPLAPVRAGSANRRAVVCLPEGLRGFASELRVTVESSPTCDSATSKTVYLDDFELVSDPSCAREP